MIETPEISIVSPVYKADTIIEQLVIELKSVLNTQNITYEIILVDDRSPDNSWVIMQQLSKEHPEVTSIRLSRNFGQHPAIMAGLDRAKGNWVVVMDCDLQDQPKEIIKMYTKAKEGFDVVLARRTKRKDSFFKRMSSKFFYKTFNFLTGVEINNEIANFGIYNKKVVKALQNIGDTLVFFPIFVKWVGFNQTTVKVDHSSRLDGKSSYKWLTLFKLAFNTIISFSNKPLILFLNFGIFISILSFFGGLVILIKALNNQIVVLGYSSIIISICFFSGIIITFLGIIGLYLSKTFNQTKKRPIFIIDYDENQKIKLGK
ncbi:MAG: glycosyltransferase family 2 protein [Flavobacteriaceae bacterium]|nr:glycosyltransferase family 2 protein [Flavobacteriaceae bacterium]